MTALRIATWNVHGLRAGIETVAAVVRAEAPDVLLVQESGSRRGLRAMAEATGLTAASDPVVFPRRRVRNAVLVRPTLEVGSHRLLRLRAGSWFAPRGVLIARLPGLTVASVHLGLRRDERRRHAEQLLHVLPRPDQQVVVGGDLNAHPDDPATRTLASSYPDVWAAASGGRGLTMPAAAPTARIDYLFASPRIRVRRAWLAGTPTASDHLLVVADLELSG
ncbi:MAG TPA: endonuclease/exonuclease/phosphatase family protein [Actinomycetota bacterium]|nr:endonuclease/exonuclease/phosphatase family protein [Actinomycetota bacterium]